MVGFCMLCPTTKASKCSVCFPQFNSVPCKLCILKHILSLVQHKPHMHRNSKLNCIFERVFHYRLYWFFTKILPLLELLSEVSFVITELRSNYIATILLYERKHLRTKSKPLSHLKSKSALCWLYRTACTSFTTANKGITNT